MIISASRRTDIPAFYAEWFLNRLREGYVYVRNPMNPHQVSQVSLSPDVVDGIVFWTKNPAPMLQYLEALQDYTYYFQFTLTSYGRDVESHLPSKNDSIIPTFQKLSSMIGRERVIWRYDPILLSDTYTMEYHKKYFRKLCDRLASYTEKCTISFLDLYTNMQRRIQPLGIGPMEPAQMEELAAYMGEVAREYHLNIDTCTEEIDLSRYGIGHASCIDRERLERISGYQLQVERDRNQRPGCGCVSSIDIGTYNTCRNGCAYCYANFNQTLLDRNNSKHDPSSPLLYGELAEGDVMKPREMKSLRKMQMEI